MSVVIKSEDELAAMREAGRLNAEIRALLRQAVAPGVTGRDLDELAKREIASRGAQPTFVGYGPGGRPPDPAAICFSVNDELVHGIPGDRPLEEGDIVSIDLGVTYRGFVSDAAFTCGVGTVTPEAERLMAVTEEALWAGIAKVRPGNHLGDISSAIGAVGQREGYGIIQDYGGHGVGRQMHEPPHIPNYGRAGVGYVLKRGMVLALEPMFALGRHATEEMADRWTVRMVDGSLSAHFEETVAVTEQGPEVLTRMDAILGVRAPEVAGVS